MSRMIVGVIDAVSRYSIEATITVGVKTAIAKQYSFDGLMLNSVYNVTVTKPNYETYSKNWRLSYDGFALVVELKPLVEPYVPPEVIPTIKLTSAQISMLNKWSAEKKYPVVNINTIFEFDMRNELTKDVIVRYIGTTGYNELIEIPIPPPVVVPVVVPPPAYKILPEPPAQLKGIGLTLYQKLDDACYRKDSLSVLSILRQMLVTEASPLPVLALILPIAKVVGVIVGIIGTVGFAKFLLEESLQTIDMSIWTATQNKQYDLVEKGLAKKKELLDVTPLEHLLSLIPAVNLVVACQQFFSASRTKYEIDVELLKRKQPTTPVNPNVSLEKTADAVAKGEDTSPYLPFVPPVVEVVPVKVELPPTIQEIFDWLMKETEGRLMITRKEVLAYKKQFGID